MTYDIYNEAMTTWHAMPQGQKDAIIAAQKAGGVAEWWNFIRDMWLVETDLPEDWHRNPRRIRPNSMPATLDLSNPLGQALCKMTPEQQAAIKALPVGEYEWMDIEGVWVVGIGCTIFAGGTYRQRPKPEPITVTVTVDAPGTYRIGADGKAEKVE